MHCGGKCVRGNDKRNGSSEKTEQHFQKQMRKHELDWMADINTVDWSNETMF